jgi:hypothetical protein
MLVKTCTKCAVEQSVTSFAPMKAGKFGVTSECRVCAAERFRAHYALNKDNYASSNKEYKALTNKKYRENNIGKIYANNAKRRALTRQATPSWSDSATVAGMFQLASIFNRTGINLHVDHIVPLKSDDVCGLNCEGNLRLMPASDNIAKGNRHWPDMW